MINLGHYFSYWQHGVTADTSPVYYSVKCLVFSLQNRPIHQHSLALDKKHISYFLTFFCKSLNTEGWLSSLLLLVLCHIKLWLTQKQYWHISLFQAQNILHAIHLYDVFQVVILENVLDWIQYKYVRQSKPQISLMIYLRSVAMPTAMHFLNRHSWHWFLVTLSITHFPSYLHE